MRETKQSEAMLDLFDRLEELGKSKAWLAFNLTPPVSRQAIATWRDVPLHYVLQVSKLLRVEPARVRPDVARIFQPERAVA